MDISYIPTGEYDRAMRPSENLIVYEGSRFVRFFKDKFAAIKYGTKSNPKIKGNCISYMDHMGCLITEEVTAKELETTDILETIVKKISVPTRWEVIASVEVTIKRKNSSGELLEHTRMYYPSEEDYNNKDKEPKMTETIFFEGNKSYLRKTIERFLTEEEMKKRFEMGGITLNPFAPDKVKKEMYETKTIYTVDKQKMDWELPERLKPFGSCIETKEKEIRYIKDSTIKPEYTEFKEYLGPTEIERDIILFKNDEPKARIEQNDEIVFKSSRTHKIKSKIVNYPDKNGTYGGEGRGTYASYDNKILYATGSQAINVRKSKDGKLGYIVGNSNEETDALVEIKGQEINIDIKSDKVKKPEEFASDILKTFKADWNVKPTSKAKYSVKNTDMAGIININSLSSENVENTKNVKKSNKTKKTK